MFLSASREWEGDEGKSGVGLRMHRLVIDTVVHVRLLINIY